MMMMPTRRRVMLSPWRREQPFQVNTFFLSTLRAPITSTSAGEDDGEEDPPYADVPRRGRRWQRKPYLTPVKDLIRRAKQERALRRANPCRRLEQPPSNGLLVPHLVPVALRLHSAWLSLLRRIPRPASHSSLHRCRACGELHVGRAGGHRIRSCEGPGSGARTGAHAWASGGRHDLVRFPLCYHLHDRVGKPRVGHRERHLVPRLPAVVELCIQAGLDLEEYPTRRRTRPVYSIDGRVVDFEPEVGAGAAGSQPPMIEEEEEEEGDEEDLRAAAERAVTAWDEMTTLAETLMEKFEVQTCGYCAEVQVGEKGHKVRSCRASGHQFRAGLHAWQEATADDLLGTEYVWHLRREAPPSNELKRYYGKAPAAVELCVQAGAAAPKRYRSMMRMDVAIPELDEQDLVA